MSEKFPKTPEIESAVSKATLSKGSPRQTSTLKKKKKKTGGSSKSSPYNHFVSPSASQSSKNTRELWLQAVNGGGTGASSKKANIGKRTPTEFWTDTLKRTGYGITPETLGQTQSLSGLKPQDMTYKSTSHYLRQMAGTEKSSKSSDSSARPMSGRPAYKSQEEYYDEVLALKKQIQQLNSESSTLKLKMRRLEEDNLKKERDMEQLLDPSKSEEMRRTLTDKRPDTGTVIYSMKQKILKLEQNLKDREAAYSKLQSDLKTTKVDEMKIQMEALYKEITRLNHVKSASGPVSKFSANSTQAAPAKESASKLRALQETIMRMNEKNVRLQNDNKSLREDLQKSLEEKSATGDKKREYEDMNKKELMTAIVKLEKRLDRAEGDTLSVVSDVDGRRQKAEGKITLEGSVAQRLDQLDKRETELLEELSKQKAIIKRLKEDRAHYRRKCDEKDREIKLLKKEVDEYIAEIDGFYDKDKARASTPRRKSSAAPAVPKRSRTPSQVSTETSASSERDQRVKVENFRENHAAKNIQREWRGFKQRKQDEDERLKRAKQQRQVKEFEEKRAAKVIQRQWRQHDQCEKDEAAELIQAAMRGHSARQVNLKRMRGYMAEDSEVTSTNDSELDEAATMLQSSIRGHQHRKSTIQSLSNYDEENIEFMQAALRAHLTRKQLLSRESSRAASPKARSPALSRSSARNLDSAGEEVDSDDVPSVRSKTSGRSSRPSMRPQSAVKKSRTPPPALDDSDDDSDSESDDDIIVTTSKKKLF